MLIDSRANLDGKLYKISRALSQEITKKEIIRACDIQVLDVDGRTRSIASAIATDESSEVLNYALSFDSKINSILEFRRQVLELEKKVLNNIVETSWEIQGLHGLKAIAQARLDAEVNDIDFGAANSNNLEEFKESIINDVNEIKESLNGKLNVIEETGLKVPKYVKNLVDLIPDEEALNMLFDKVF